MVRYLNPAEHNPRRVTKADQNFAKRLDLKIKNSQSNIETFTKSKKKNSISISVLAIKINKNIQSIYQNNAVKKKILKNIIDRRRRKKHCFYHRF